MRHATGCLVFAACLALTGCQPKEVNLPPPPDNSDRYAPKVLPMEQSYVNARKSFATVLFTKGPSPQKARPFEVPRDVNVLNYPSGDLQLKGWSNLPAFRGIDKHPAVVFCHGGYAFDPDDWAMAKPLRDAGFIVFAPMVRGENGLPGEFSMFFNEVDDVVAAAEFLRTRPEVDPKHIYVCGHSVGGTLAMLAAMDTNIFKAGASFSGSPDQILFFRGNLEFQPPFDVRNPDELAIRSPLAFPTSFQCPFRIYRGEQEAFFSRTSTKLAELAGLVKLNVQTEAVPGNHYSAVPEEMGRAIAFFRQQQ